MNRILTKEVDREVIDLRKKLALSFIMIMWFSFFPLMLPGTGYIVDAAEIPAIPEKEIDPVNGNANTFYFVAMFYYDTWRYNDGTWDPAAPGSDVAGVTFPYAFDLPGYIVKSVSVRGFNKSFVDQNRPFWQEVFRRSRYNQYEWNNMSEELRKDITQKL